MRDIRSRLSQELEKLRRVLSLRDPTGVPYLRSLILAIVLLPLCLLVSRRARTSRDPRTVYCVSILGAPRWAAITDVFCFVAQRAALGSERSILLLFPGQPDNKFLVSQWCDTIQADYGVRVRVVHRQGLCRALAIAFYLSRAYLPVSSFAGTGLVDYDKQPSPGTVRLTAEQRQESEIDLRHLGIARPEHSVVLAMRELGDDLFGFASKSPSKNAVLYSSPERFGSAVGVFTRAGLQLVRVAKRPAIELPNWQPSNSVIDYARRARTEMTDVYLASNCLFCISDGSGFHWLASASGRPTLFTNLSLPSSPLRSDSIFLPIRFWSIRDGRLLRVREMAKLGPHLFQVPEIRRHQLEAIRPEEELVAEACSEMIDFARGDQAPIRPSDEQFLLTRDIQAAFAPKVVRGRVSLGFARQFWRELSE